MTGPTVELFSTSILSNVKVRTRHERFTSVLAIKKIPYVYHDLASDDDAKSRWRRKAKDPQLPGILVNNEWVGSYDEFEEAVEFGELELFLGVSPAAAQAAPTAPHPAQSAVSSKDPSLYPTLPYASEGAGRWKEPDADEFISKLNIKEDEINDADVDAMLADLANLPPQPATTSETKKYVPSKEAAIKPLRLAKMGPTTSHQRMPSGSPGPSPSGSAGTRASPIARYSATQRSTKALAAEAAALTSTRTTAGAKLREAVSQGKTLDDAMEESQMKTIVGQDNLDDLFASLGLSNVDIGDDEVDQFLEQGAIPQGLRLGGDRVHRASSIADKARDQTVARDLALKAKERGHGSARGSLSNESGKPASLQAASEIPSTAEDGLADTSTTSGLASALSSVTLTEAPPDALNKSVESIPEADANDDNVSKDEIVSATDADAAKGVIVETTSVAKSEAEAERSSETDEEAKAQTATSRESEEPIATSAAAEPQVTKAELDDPNVAKPIVLEEQSPVQILPVSSSSKEVTVPTADPKEEVSTGTSGLNDKTVDEPEVTAASSGPEEWNEAVREPKVVESGSRQSLTGTREEDDVAGLSHGVVESETLKMSDAAREPETTKTTDVETANETTEDAQLSKSASQSHVTHDRTPTKETPEDPIKSHDLAAAASPAVEDESDLSLELAQAAMIASRFQDHTPEVTTQPTISLPEASESAHAVTSGSDPKSLDVTSPIESAAFISPIHSPLGEGTDGTGDAASPTRLGLGAPRESSRKLSSASTRSTSSSSRRAIDVSRPIDPSMASPPPPTPQSSSSDASTSPDAKKKFGGIRGLSFGRDKEKEKEKDRQAASPSKPAEAAKGGTGTSRHERTISQILREADAVLGLDDDEDGSYDDDTEDSVMFGTSSIDVDPAAAPTPAVRGSSRKY